MLLAEIHMNIPRNHCGPYNHILSSEFVEQSASIRQIQVCTVPSRLIALWSSISEQ